MEFTVTQQLLNFRCPNCEFSTLDTSLIQKHLCQCLPSKDQNELGEEYKPQIEAVLCGETTDELVIELVEENVKAELDTKDVNVQIEVDRLQQPKIEAVICGDTAEILYEMEDDNLEYENEMETDENCDPELETNVNKEEGQVSQNGRILQFEQLLQSITLN